MATDLDGARVVTSMIDHHYTRTPQDPTPPTEPIRSSNQASTTRVPKVAVMLALLALVAALAIARGIGPGASDTAGPAHRATLHRVDQARAAVPGDSWASLPATDPTPVPPSTWLGWDTQARGRCAWLPDGLLDPLRPAAEPTPTDTHCRVDLASGTALLITWTRPGTAILSTPFAVRRSIRVAGLPSRRDEPFLLRPVMPGACQIVVPTHALTSPAVLAWRPSNTARRTIPAAMRASPCDDATLAAELISRRLVTAAGGAPWRGTPRTPGAAAIAATTACDLLEPTAGEFGLDLVGTTARRTPGHDSCTYDHDGTAITAQLLTGRVADTHPGTTPVAYRPFAGLAARQDLPVDGCVLTVQITPTQVLRTTYRSATHTRPCVAAELLTANALTFLLNRTNP
jgi:hypothetical protein